MSALISPTLSIDVDISADQLSFSLTDTTGTYPTPTTGYGTPNIPSSAVTLNKVGIYQYGDTIPSLLTFTIASNVITAATLTTPSGVVTNVYSSLTSTAWPFIGGVNPLPITNVILGFAATDKMTDQVYTFSYEISGSYVNSMVTYTFDLITSLDQLYPCNTQCCVEKMAVNMGNGCCSDCMDDKLWKYLKAKAMLCSAIASADVGQYESAQCAITKASEICTGNCNTC